MEDWIEYIKANCKLGCVKDWDDNQWDYNYILENPNISWDIINDNLDKDWSVWDYCSNPTITWA
jgi:hypothetical protein